MGQPGPGHPGYSASYESDEATVNPGYPGAGHGEPETGSVSRTVGMARVESSLAGAIPPEAIPTTRSSTTYTGSMHLGGPGPEEQVRDSAPLPPRRPEPPANPVPTRADAPARRSTQDAVAEALAMPLPDDDDDPIPPWDRKPLIIVIVSAIILVLIGILSGVASAAYFDPGQQTPRWNPGGKTSPTPSTNAVAPPPPVGDTITLSGVGDVIMGTEPNHLPPANGSTIFNPVKTALASDLVMGNLETPLTADTGYVKCGLITPSPSPGNPKPKPIPDPECFQFHLPTSYAGNLHAGGFQVMNLANNHTNDEGAQGLANTRTALTAAGVQHTGAPGQITYLMVKGVKVAVLGFSVYSWGANMNDQATAVGLVKQAAANADVVVIQMQAGAEGADKSHVVPGHEIFVGEDRGDEIAFTHAVIDAGADIVFGHGPHIMRGMQFYKGRLIAYSLGNFCGYGVLSSTGFLGVGGVLKVTLHKDGTWAGGTLIPTEMINGGLPAPDPDKRALAFVDGLSTNDFGATAAHISHTNGTITPPTT
jgi:hypothetical protein